MLDWEFVEMGANPISSVVFSQVGLPRWLSGKESACQCKRLRFDPWVRKILWRRAWQLTLVFLPGESMDREAWWAAVHGVIHQTWLKRLSTHVYLQLNYDRKLRHISEGRMGVERGWVEKRSDFWKLYCVVLFSSSFSSFGFKIACWW